MATCSRCGGVRVDNILQHADGCEFRRDTLRATAEAASTADRLRLHPDLVALEGDLERWYGETAG